MEDQTLFVLIGAGASFDSTSKENTWGSVQLPDGWDGNDRPIHPTPRGDLRPPLVTGLFDPNFAQILNRYPLAQMAASDIRTHDGESEALEDFLRTRYRDSEHELDRRKFHAIHWYLQDLLWTISRNYTQHPDNYDRLITATERLRRVVYITLNYDTLLDDRLRFATAGSLRGLDDYCSHHRSWSLIKPHGSVDWGLRISPSKEWQENGFNLIREPPADIQVNREDYHLRRGNNLREVRLESQGALWFYPALSVPLGARGTFTCPDHHIEFLREELARQDRLDVLMLGYSGLDDEVLKLFGQADRPLGQTAAVAGSYGASVLALQRLHAAVPRQPMGDGVAVDTTFSEFVSETGLGAFLASR